LFRTSEKGKRDLIKVVKFLDSNISTYVRNVVNREVKRELRKCK
jgi:hypothetical protein